MSNRHHDTRLGAYALISDDEARMLLARWNDGSRMLWTVPGGGVELHEQPEEALVRELREESGYDVAVDALIGVHVEVIPPDRRRSRPVPLRLVRLLYTARITSGTLRPESDGSTDAVRWIPLGEIPSLARADFVDPAIEMAVRSHVGSLEGT